MNTLDLNRSFVILDRRSGIQDHIGFFLDPRLRPRGLVDDGNVLIYRYFEHSTHIFKYINIVIAEFGDNGELFQAIDKQFQSV